MLASGWQEDVAVDALESTLARPPGAEGGAAGAAGCAACARAPDWTNRRLYLDGGDRQGVRPAEQCTTRASSSSADLLSHDECDALVEMASPAWRVGNGRHHTGGRRSSRSHRQRDVFGRGENALIRRIEARIAHCSTGRRTRVRAADPALPGHPVQAALRLFRPGSPARQRSSSAVASGWHPGHVLGPPERAVGRFSGPGPRGRTQRGNAVFFSYEHPTRPPRRCTAARRCSPATNGSPPSGCARTLR